MLDRVCGPLITLRLRYVARTLAFTCWLNHTFEALLDIFEGASAPSESLPAPSEALTAPSEALPAQSEAIQISCNAPPALSLLRTSRLFQSPPYKPFKVLSRS